MSCNNCSCSPCCCVTPFRYKGPNVDCLGVLTNTTYDSLIEAFANEICDLNEAVQEVHGVDHISFTSSTGNPPNVPGQAGQIDTYTVWADVSETIALGTINITNGVSGTDGTDGTDGINGTDGMDAEIYDSGWKVLNNYTGLQGFGIAPLTNWINPSIRVIDRVVHMKGRYMIPLAAAGGSTTLVTDVADYPLTRDTVRTYEGIDGGFSTNPAGGLSSQNPIVPVDLRPESSFQISLNKIMSRVLTAVDGGGLNRRGINFTTLVSSVSLLSTGKIFIATKKDEEQPSVAAQYFHNSALHSIIDKVTFGDFIGDQLGSINGYRKVTSGVLVPGREYTLDTYVAGDDFSNVGLNGAHVAGMKFIATDSVPPTDWSNGSTLTYSRENNTVTDYTYPVSFDGEDEEHFGGMVIDFSFTYPVAKTTSIADITAAFNSI